MLIRRFITDPIATLDANVMAVMVGARELLRRALLAPWFSPAQLPVQPERPAPSDREGQ